MPAQNVNSTEAKESDPWWAKYWYASVIALSIWMLVAIYGAVNYELELKNARVIVREMADRQATGLQICQIELWLVVIVVPLSLVIVNTLLAWISRDQN